MKGLQVGLGLEPCEERLRDGDSVSQGRAWMDGFGHVAPAC